jgi:tetratricopeptide repeat protein 30
MALLNMEREPANGFEKLHFLLEANPCPPETFGNLLLLYIQHEHYGFAADMLAQYPQAAFELLDPADRAFIDAVLLKQGSAEESYKKLDEMAIHVIESLRELTRKVQLARQSQDNDAIKSAIADYDLCMERYVPLVMAQGKIYWDLEQYATVEKILRRSIEFCSDQDTWKLNLAHVLFMQEKYRDAIEFYEPIVHQKLDNVSSF